VHVGKTEIFSTCTVDTIYQKYKKETRTYAWSVEILSQ
jgi:hypothetical protein